MQTQVLRQLVRDSRYPIDEGAIARAIVARIAARSIVARVVFNGEPRAPRVRSFRRARHVRSFTLCDPNRRALRR